MEPFERNPSGRTHGRKYESKSIVPPKFLGRSNNFLREGPLGLKFGHYWPSQIPKQLKSLKQKSYMILVKFRRFFYYILLEKLVCFYRIFLQNPQLHVLGHNFLISQSQIEFMGLFKRAKTVLQYNKKLYPQLKEYKFYASLYLWRVNNSARPCTRKLNLIHSQCLITFGNIQISSDRNKI